MTALECEMMPAAPESRLETVRRLQETIEQLRETIRLQAGALAGKDRLIAELLDRPGEQNIRMQEWVALVAAKDLELAELRAQIEDLQRQLYGSRSEKLQRPEQDESPDEAEQPNEAAEPARRGPPPSRTNKDPAARRQGGGRAPIPEELEVIQIIIDLPEAEKFCRVTGEPLEFLRNEITRKIDFITGQWVCREYVRPMYARRADLKAAVMKPVLARLPPQLLPGSAIESGYLAHLIVSRFLDHLPWYRQEQIARRGGVELSRRKLGRWSAEVAGLLEPIYRFLGTMVVQALFWMADETFVNVLDPERPGKARKAWLWVYLSLEAKAVVFDFNASRNQDSPLKFFPAAAQGDLLTDGYSVYPAVLAQRPGIVHCCCWSHTRRGFEKALAGGGQIVRDILLDIQKLFAIDREARLAGMSATERETLRRNQGVPAILDGLYKKMTQAKADTLPQNRTHKAADYALNRWQELGVFAQPGKGHVELSTNLLENKIRPVALGRRNSLFIGHPKAGKKSAIFYSIFATCKLCGVCPEKYLRWLFPKLAAATNQTIATLTPHALAEELARDAAAKAKTGAPEPAPAGAGSPPAAPP